MKLIKLLFAQTIFLYSCLISICFAGDVAYVATNKVSENTLAMFKKDSNGKYQLMKEFGTGGKGTGDLEVPDLKKDTTHPLANGDDPLISANGVVVTNDGKYILVVNAGDESISSLKVNSDDSLTFVSSVKASDRFPLSVANHGNSVVVASLGKTNNHGSIAAYTIQNGILKSVEGSRRDLSARPSTISFINNGLHVLVNELVTGKIKVFGFAGNTLSDKPISVIDSPRVESERFQAIPVGFAVNDTDEGSFILMSEARFLTPEFSLRQDNNKVPLSPKYSWQTGSLSTYRVDLDGQISLISADVLTGEAIEGGEIANCWVVTSKDGRTLWAANALSSSISSFHITKNGGASLKNAKAFKDNTEQLFFSDLSINPAGDQLFQLVGNRGEVMVFDIQANGDLILKHTVAGMPLLGTYGMLVR